MSILMVAGGLDVSRFRYLKLDNDQCDPIIRAVGKMRSVPMIMTCNLKCMTCQTIVRTRTAVGHGDYQEFAYACPGCGVEIRYGMELLLRKRIEEARENAASEEDFRNRMREIAGMQNVEYVNLKNCEIEDRAAKSVKTLTLDGEQMIPLSGDHFSPFMALAEMSLDYPQFLEQQGMRLNAIEKIWPEISRLNIHAERQQWPLFDAQFKEFGLDWTPTTEVERKRAVFSVAELYGPLFSLEAQTIRTRVSQRFAFAESTSPGLMKQLVGFFQNAHKDESLIRELNSIREKWVRVYNLLSPVFACLYWDDAKATLDDYTLAQKRFDELKPLYVDCFETFCRISVIAAGLEGIILKNTLGVPTPNKIITLKEFDLMKNGLKPGVLTHLPIGDLFVPFMDNALRNGIGHHSAHYEVKADVIEYFTENQKGRKPHVISYIRFCEKVMRMYGQLEAVSSYANWLRMKALGL
jgi:hypothetical protein